MTRDAWLARRRTCITASDAAAIIGLHPYRTRFDVWAHKQGITPDTPDNEFMYWGRELEDVIARRYAADTGRVLRRHDYEVVVHPVHSWLGGTPDRTIPAVPAGLEIKTAGYRSAERWGDAGDGTIPEEYTVQCAVYMACTGYEAWDLAVLIGGQDYRVYNLHRDAELEAMIIDECARFRTDYVVTNRPPTPDASAGCAAWLATRYPSNAEPPLVATPEDDILIGKLRDCRTEQAAIAARRAEYEAAVKALIGTHDGIEGSHGKLTWRRNRDSARTDWEQVAARLRAAVPPSVWQQAIDAATTTVPGPRVLRVPRKWLKEDDQ